MEDVAEADLALLVGEERAADLLALHVAELALAARHVERGKRGVALEHAREHDGVRLHRRVPHERRGGLDAWELPEPITAIVISPLNLYRLYFQYAEYEWIGGKEYYLL